MKSSHSATGGRACSAHAVRDRDGQRTTFVTITEVAERLNVCERTVRRWIDSKALPAHRLGRLVRISQADLAAFLATHRDA
jgi:excisionase family DNA binding protein